MKEMKKDVLYTLTLNIYEEEKKKNDSPYWLTRVIGEKGVGVTRCSL